ncbi:MAG TPA: alpha/beta hydrolase [Candidatus Bathyarchaeia archaeon]|nr:alpha/beta hydrolase [Candidatus Bathyarchaeia archaeon]
MSEKRVFIIHGWGKTPESEWLPWLAKHLREKRFLTEVPVMPDTDNPKIEAWVSHLEKVVGRCDKNTFFVGHSIGCQAIMRYLEKLSADEKCGGAVFVAGWFTLTGFEENEERFIASPWVNKPIDFEKVKARAEKIICIISDNDPFVPAENWEIFSENLGAEVIIEKNMGHFSDDDGIKVIPVALDAVLKLTKSENNSPEKE